MAKKKKAKLTSLTFLCMIVTGMFPDSNIARLARVFWGERAWTSEKAANISGFPILLFPSPLSCSRALPQPKRQLRLATQATGKTCSVDLRVVFDRDVAASNLDVVHRKQNTGSVTQKASLTQNPRKPHTPCPFSLSVFMHAPNAHSVIWPT